MLSLKDARARAPDHPIVGQKFTTSDEDNDSWIDGNYFQKVLKFHLFIYLFHLYLFF